MGFLIKSDVINALNEDKKTSMMCYQDKATREIIQFCYDSMEREICRLPQYKVENVEELKFSGEKNESRRNRFKTRNQTNDDRSRN